jgi:hypothetical protein
MTAQRPGRDRRAVAAAGLATAIRVGVLAAMVEVTGAHALGQVFGHWQLPWIALVAWAELPTYPAYILAYRSS